MPGVLSHSASRALAPPVATHAHLPQHMTTQGTTPYTLGSTFPAHSSAACVCACRARRRAICMQDLGLRFASVATSGFWGLSVGIGTVAMRAHRGRGIAQEVWASARAAAAPVRQQGGSICQGSGGHQRHGQPSEKSAVLKRTGFKRRRTLFSSVFEGRVSCSVEVASVGHFGRFGLLPVARRRVAALQSHVWVAEARSPTTCNPASALTTQTSSLAGLCGGKSALE